MTTLSLAKRLAIRPSFTQLSSGTLPLQWWKTPANKLDSVSPTFYIDTKDNRFLVNGQVTSQPTAYTVSNASAIRTYIDQSGALVTAAANTPRIDWSFGFPRLLLEGATTGLCAGGTNPRIWTLSGSFGFKSDFAGAWGIADKPAIYASGGAYWHRLQAPAGNGVSLAAGDALSLSAVVKPGSSGKAYFELRNDTTALGSAVRVTGDWLAPIVTNTTAGSVSRLSSKALPGGLYLIRFVVTLADASAFITFGVGPNSDVAGEDIVVFAGQVEKASYPTSIILNNSATQLTRTADLCTLHASAGDMTAWAWRGYVPSLITGQILLGVNSGAYIRAGNADQTTLLLEGSNTNAAVLPPGQLPGNVGFCGGWGASGRRCSNNGGAVGADSVVPDRSRTTMYIGPVLGLFPGQVIYLDELIGWVLPDRPSAAGVQSQARAAA